MQIEQIQKQLEEGNSLKEIIQIIPYLSFAKKKILCDNVLTVSLEYTDDGLLQCDYFTRKLIMDISIIINYTDIEVNQQDILTDYDTLNEIGVVEYVLNNMTRSERFFIEDMISKNIKQRVAIENSIEGILVKGINKLVEKIPTDKQLKSLSKSLLKDFNKLDMSKVAELKDVFNTINKEKVK